MANGVELDTSKLEKILRENGPAFDKVVRQTAFIVQGKASVNAPYKTGNLKASIRAIRRGIMHYEVIDGTEYGIFVELPGVTRRWAGKPFMRPAVIDTREHFFNGLKKALSGQG